MFNENNVLAPMQLLISNYRNVLIGMRLVEKVDVFPAPTESEIASLFNLHIKPEPDFSYCKNMFQKWLLIKGFEDLQKYILEILQNVYVFYQLKSGQSNETGLPELLKEAQELNFPEAIGKVKKIFGRKLRCAKHLDALNTLRNCLVHSQGIVKKRYCNNQQNDKLILSATKLKFYFLKEDGEEVPLEKSRVGPENSPLMLGTEEFTFEFLIDQEINFSMDNFMKVFTFCLFFFNNEITEELKKVKIVNKVTEL